MLKKLLAVAATITAVFTFNTASSQAVVTQYIDHLDPVTGYTYCVANDPGTQVNTLRCYDPTFAPEWRAYVDSWANHYMTFYSGVGYNGKLRLAMVSTDHCSDGDFYEVHDLANSVGAAPHNDYPGFTSDSYNDSFASAINWSGGCAAAPMYKDAQYANHYTNCGGTVGGETDCNLQDSQGNDVLSSFSVGPH